MIVRSVEPDDVQAVSDLLAELDDFYGSPSTEAADDRVRQIRDALFGTPPAAMAIVALDADRLIGMASYSYLWPAAGVTRSLYLKELFVTKNARRSGVGRSLMSTLFEVAQKAECSRVEWTTEIDNQAARDFYRGLGATVLEGKVSYRVSVASDDADLRA